jgi:hypothetical protein
LLTYSSFEEVYYRQRICHIANLLSCTRRNFVVSSNIDENLEDLAKNCQANFDCERIHIVLFWVKKRKGQARSYKTFFFVLFCIITSSSISFSSCPSFTFHYNVNHSHYHNFKVSFPFSSVILICVCQFCFMIIGLFPFVNLLCSLEFLY